MAEPSRPLERDENFVETVKPIKKSQLLDMITVIHFNFNFLVNLFCQI
jgi:hypothetical protein